MALEIDQTWKRENFVDNDDAHDATRSETLPYKSTSIYVNMAASVQLRTDKQKYGAESDASLSGSVCMLEIVSYLRECNDMETHMQVCNTY